MNEAGAGLESGAGVAPQGVTDTVGDWAVTEIGREPSSREQTAGTRRQTVRQMDGQMDRESVRLMVNQKARMLSG